MGYEKDRKLLYTAIEIRGRLAAPSSAHFRLMRVNETVTAFITVDRAITTAIPCLLLSPGGEFPRPEAYRPGISSGTPEGPNRYIRSVQKHHIYKLGERAKNRK
jgi:hypothetical protein